MRQKNLHYLFSLLLTLTCFDCLAQSKGKFAINPYVNGNFSVSDKYLEVGPSFDSDTVNITYYHASGNPINDTTTITSHYSILTKNRSNRILVRIPLTKEGGNSGLIDRQINDVRLGYTYLSDKHGLEVRPTSRGYSYSSWGIKAEIGYKEYTYYPTGNPDVKEDFEGVNAAAELIFGLYNTRDVSRPASVAASVVNTDRIVGVRPSGWQFRLRVDHQFKAADALGVPGSPINGLTTNRSLILERPSNKTIISPAFAYINTSATHNFQHVGVGYVEPAFKNDFKNYQSTRLRLEYWIIMFPAIASSINTKIGVGPLLNVRLGGTDDLRKVEAGAQITVRIDSLPARFFE